MKKIILILGLAFYSQVYGQKYVVTPNGLRDEKNVENTYLVLEATGHTAKQLFNNAIKYVYEKYKNPEEVIKGRTEGEFLIFDNNVPDFFIYNLTGSKTPIQATYTTKLGFKDDKVKIEIVSLDMIAKTNNYHVLFSGGLYKGYIIYKKNGTLFNEEAKTDIENYFSTYLIDLLKYLKGEDNSGDW